jgi:hypothetical protein
MITSYLSAAVRREPQYGDATVGTYLRTQQCLSNLRNRAREARGRRATV